jgi:deoxyuridine 5'-triphosphate nucleotidohydrolase
MKVRIKTFDGEALFYESEGACWFDFKTKEEVIFEPWEFKLVDTGTVVEVPKWYVLQISPRSSTFKKHWLVQVNSVWIIDNDYCWENDTVKFAYLNISKEKVVIEVGTRIWQWVFLPVWIAEFEVVNVMWNKDRWGFGSTGVK